MSAPSDSRERALAKSLAPIFDRVNTVTHWVRKPGAHFSHVKRPLKIDSVVKHVQGVQYVGVCPIKPGESVTMLGVLDLDSHKGDTSWPDMQVVAMRVCDALQRQGGAPVSFRSSGGQGMHIYTLWAEPQDAYSVRKYLAAALATAGFAAGVAGVSKGEIEVFPKSDSVAASKYGNMIIAPLAGASVPLDPFELDDCPRDYLVGMVWPMSAPVPVLEKPERAASSVVKSESADSVNSFVLLRSALAGIPNALEKELDYDAWRNVVFAIHHTTHGNDEGLLLAHEFSAKASKYDAGHLDNGVWPYIDSERDGAITIGTVLRLARSHGWQEPADLIMRDFEVLSHAAGGAHLPVFERDAKGRIEPTIGNAVKALRHADVCGFRVAYDTFKDERFIKKAGSGDWLPFGDADYTRLRVELEERGFKAAGRELVRDALALITEEDRIDTAQIWLSDLAWDGVSRVNTFLSRYLGAEDTEYVQAVSRYMWTAMAGRIVQPGVKADGVPILEGPQGIGKSSAVAALAPAPEFYTEVSFSEKADDLARKMRGVLVAEIGELAGLYAREREAVKSFISRTHETWTPKYQEYKVTIARRLIFIGTTNQREILADETGNRRWLPVHVTRADLAGIARDRLQLWAEGRDLFCAGGVAYGAAVEQATDSHEAYRMVDSWEEAVRLWLEDDTDFDEIGRTDGPRWGSPFTTSDVAIGALGIAQRDINPAITKRIASVLRGMGFESRAKRVRNQPVRRWCPAPTCCFLREVDGADLV